MDSDLISVGLECGWVVNRKVMPLIYLAFIMQRIPSEINEMNE